MFLKSLTSTFSRKIYCFHLLLVLYSEVDSLLVHGELSSSCVPSLAEINLFLYVDILHGEHTHTQTASLLGYHKV